MHIDRRLFTLILLLSAAAQGCAAHGTCVGAGLGGPGPHRRAIHVAGVGEVQAVPDIARMSLGAEARGATARQAADAVNAQMQKVVTALTEAGVAKADLQTQNLSLYYERHNPPPRPPMAEMEAAEAKPEGQYVARNTVEVTLRQLDRAPEVIAAATRAGANTMHGLSFDVEDRTPHVTRARELAVRNAQADAKQLAELNGVQLGDVLSVVDGVADTSPQPMGMMRAMAAEAAPSVERGELTVRHTVTLVIELAE